MRPFSVLAACVLCCLLSAAARADQVLACFEGTDYGGWKTTGEAFGPGPAQGTLPDQMPVSGYKGHGLANSFFHGDATVGTLTSPEFHINFTYLNFLIGGGNHPGKTCLNLLVDGKVVYTATGRDSEQLAMADLRPVGPARQAGRHRDRGRRNGQLGTHPGR